ncbi:hypothetical protein F5X97DRAFT_53685 [Nemania serpens]|nr:hypothetical protein F5X97DRAFT_53685 [Nemania serpens]
MLVTAGEFTCGWELACEKLTPLGLPDRTTDIWAELAPRPMPPSPTGEPAWGWAEELICPWPDTAFPKPSFDLWALC